MKVNSNFGLFQNPIKHLRWKFCENSNFCKTLHLRCLTGFWIQLEYVIGFDVCPQWHFLFRIYFLQQLLRWMYLSFFFFFKKGNFWWEYIKHIQIIYFVKRSSPIPCHWSLSLLNDLNPFHATGLFLCPLETSENHWLTHWLNQLTGFYMRATLALIGLTLMGFF